jgi:hypothetical protein
MEGTILCPPRRVKPRFLRWPLARAVFVFRLAPMADTRGKAALMEAFERLFARAASKLNVEFTPQDLEEAKRNFAERFEQILGAMDQVQAPAISDELLGRMESAIDELSPASIAAHLAAVPLGMHMQESLRQLALKAAEQRVLEHLVLQADDRYGGN